MLNISNNMQYPFFIVARALCFLVLITLISCKEKNHKTSGEYPKDFPEECVVAYDMRRDLWDARENSKRIQLFWQKDTEQGRKDRKDGIAAYGRAKKTEDYMNRIIKNCKMAIPALKVRIELAKRADNMSREEFKEVYGHASKEELDMIFGR